MTSITVTESCSPVVQTILVGEGPHEAKEPVQLTTTQSTVATLASVGAAGLGEPEDATPVPAATDVVVASSALYRYEVDQSLASVNFSDLQKLSVDSSAPAAARDAARFMLANPEVHETTEIGGVVGAQGAADHATFRLADGQGAVTIVHTHTATALAAAPAAWLAATPDPQAQTQMATPGAMDVTANAALLSASARVAAASESTMNASTHGLPVHDTVTPPGAMGLPADVTLLSAVASIAAASVAVLQAAMQNLEAEDKIAPPGAVGRTTDAGHSRAGSSGH